MIEAIDHVNLVVRDLAGMTRFYRDVLGLKVTKEVTISGQWIDEVVGLTDVLADVVYLDLETGSRIELIAYRRPVGQQADINDANTPGIRHLAFRVSDIDAMAVKLRDFGVSLGSEIATVPQTQVSYADGARKRLVYFHDPEGNLLELCEYR